jgi:hypothetical protein
MSDVRAHFLVRFYATLPDDDGDADDAFDRMGDEVLAVLNGQAWAEAIVAESFSIATADTEPDE